MLQAHRGARTQGDTLETPTCRVGRPGTDLSSITCSPCEAARGDDTLPIGDVQTHRGVQGTAGEVAVSIAGAS